MDTEKCKVLLRSVDTGSFTKAAEELGYTPSGVTHMMNALEEDLGVTLLRRTRSGVSLTSAGHDLIGPIRELVAAADKLDQNVAELKGMTVGHVAFASGASFARYIVPEVVARFKERYPNITLEIMEAGGGDMREAIAEHRISMGFLTRKESDRNFISLFGDDMLAIVPEGHPLAECEEMDLEELAKYPYIGVNLDYDHDVEYLVKGRGFSAKPFLVSRIFRIFAPRILLTELHESIISESKTDLEHHFFRTGSRVCTGADGDRQGDKGRHQPCGWHVLYPFHR